MTRKALLTLSLILVASLSYAQTDSIKYTKDFVFKDGLYVTIDDLKNNRPTLTPENFRLYNSDTNFVGMKKKNAFGKWKKVHYPDTLGSIKEKPLGNFFGYTRENTIYIFNNNQVYRIFKLGLICYGFQVGDLSSEVDNHMSPQGNYIPPYIYNPIGRFGQHLHPQEFLMDFRTGNVYEYSRQHFETLLKNIDSELYVEYSKLSSSKKKKMMFIYLNNVNEKHPIYFGN